MRKRHLISLALVLAVAALALSGPALASGGRYVFDGGTSAQRAQVRSALDASAFDWGIVPGTITIHLAAGTDSEAAPGEVWVDTDLLTAGRFAWATIQHEYAHEVDFLLLNEAKRQQLNAVLGGRDWCYTTQGLAHRQHGCERFATLVAWAYWPSADNALQPVSASDEAAGVDPVAFRTLLAKLIGAPDTLGGRRTLASHFTR